MQFTCINLGLSVNYDCFIGHFGLDGIIAGMENQISLKQNEM